jgi:hypothetical protein
MRACRSIVVAVLAAAVAACSDDAPAVCLGDCTQPLELAPTGLRSGDLVALGTATEVDILPPDQGGFVIYVGVRARNVHERGASLSAALRSTTTTQVLAIEERPAMFVLGNDGWADPVAATQDQANLPVCGPVPGPMDFDAMTWRVELTLRDRDGRTAQASATINPRCAGFRREDCMCSCQFGGGECMLEVDGGVDGSMLDAGTDGP